jgi:hypothetical protein
MAWRIQGQYMETCNCAFVCPCIVSNLAARPTEGGCKAVMGMLIEKGEKDGVKLDGLAFAVVISSPGPMADGDMTVGLIVDERADPQQTDAIAAISTGAVGGPMAVLAPLVGRMAGIEKRPIRFEAQGMRLAFEAGELVDQACEGVASMADPDVPIYLDNTAHPANTKLALAKATRSSFNAFGIEWQDTSGARNGHFAPFSWSP